MLTSKSLKIRGYVEISLLGFGSADLLLTPEHRGTFLPTHLAAATPDFDQLAYALPTATGSSLFKLTGAIKPIKPEIDKIAEKLPDDKLPVENNPILDGPGKPILDGPGKPVTDKLDNSNLASFSAET